MSKIYDCELSALRQEIQAGGASPTVIDARVNALLVEGGDSLVADLLLSLSDDAEYDEGMFSLIHAAESLDTTPYSKYIAALLSVFSSISISAPRWSSILLMRVMNSEASRHELIHQLRNSPSPVKESVRAVCGRINNVSPEFLVKTVAVTLAAT